MSDGTPDDRLTPEMVAAFLGANPSFLRDYNLGRFSPDTGRGKDNVVDLSPAIARRARQEVQEMRRANKSMLHVAANNMVSWQRLHHATLALLASTDIPSLCDVVENEFPAIFDLAECHLVVDSAAHIPGNAGFRCCNRALIDAATNHGGLALGAPNQDAQQLLDGDCPSVALIRLPDRLLSPVSDCLILLAGRDADSFTPDLGGDLLILLAEMVGVTLAARLEIIDRIEPQ